MVLNEFQLSNISSNDRSSNRDVPFVYIYHYQLIFAAWQFRFSLSQFVATCVIKYQTFRYFIFIFNQMDSKRFFKAYQKNGNFSEFLVYRRCLVQIFFAWNSPFFAVITRTLKEFHVYDFFIFMHSARNISPGQSCRPEKIFETEKQVSLIKFNIIKITERTGINKK